MEKSTLKEEIVKSLGTLNTNGLNRVMCMVSLLEKMESCNINTSTARLEEIKAETDKASEEKQKRLEETERQFQEREELHRSRYENDGILGEIGKSKCYTLVTGNGKYKKEFDEIMQRTSASDHLGNAIDFFTLGCIVGAKETKLRQALKKNKA